MPSRTGKCTNYTKCTIAYRNQPLDVSGDFVCPECGQPLHEIGQAKKAAPKQVPMIAGGVVLLIVLVSVFFIARRPSKHSEQPTVMATPESVPATPEPAPPSTTPLPEPATPPIAATPTTPPPTPLPPAEPPPPETSVAEVAQPVVLEQSVNVDPKSAENQEIKREVLKRIEKIPEPKLSEADKDKLYAHVERARGMGKVITIPFASSQTTLSAQNIGQLKAATQSPQIAKMVSDPTVVFVILGFADKQGNADVNLKISNNRAESAMQALRDKCGLLNVMHPVGMGGSDLFDTGDRARNRVVEVWAVLP